MKNWLTKLILIFLLGVSCFAQETNDSRLISVSFKNTDVQEVMELLSKKMNRNIIVQKGVDAKITARLDKMEPVKILDLICRTHQLSYVEEGGVLIVHSRESYLAEGSALPTSNALIEAQNRSAKYIFTKITVKGADLGDSDNGVGISPFGGKIYFDNLNNSLIVIDTPTNIEKTRALIEQFDVPLKSVLIEAKIVNVTLKDEQRYGLDWTKLNFGNLEINAPFKSKSEATLKYGESGVFHKGKIKGAAWAVEGVLDMVGENNKTRLLSNPRINVISGQEARIVVGKNLAYKTITYASDGGSSKPIEDYKYVQTGVKLNVTPEIYGKTVRLKIHPEVSVGEQAEPGVAPPISTSEADSVVYLEDGETLILGGLIEEQDVKLRKGVPYLMKVPVLGLLFSSGEKKNNRSELVVFITVKIIS